VVDLGEEIAQALRKSLLRNGYKTLTKVAAVPIKEEFEKKAALHLMKDQGRGMLGVGDDGVRTVLEMPKKSTPSASAQAPDFLSVSKSGKLVVSEAKGGDVDVIKALGQLENAMKKLAERNLVGDVERVEIIIPKGAPLKGDFAILDGYLVKPSDGNALVTVRGFKDHNVAVIEL
jgi:hypothetical protein